jgi:predicted Zn-dependent protease
MEAEKILEVARKAGARQAEVFHVSNDETPVKFEANRLKELNARQTAGVALRVIVNGRIGFASSTYPGDQTDGAGGDGDRAVRPEARCSPARLNRPMRPTTGD